MASAGPGDPRPRCRDLVIDVASAEERGKMRVRGYADRQAMNATPGKKILLVDDDEALRQSLSEQLRLHEEFSTVEAGNGGDGMELAKQEYFDAILLDVGLPDMDGREVCRLMRRNGVKSPIIMLTAAESDADTILGLDAGANDYVTKPFKLGVLLARLRAQLRQPALDPDIEFLFQPFARQHRRRHAHGGFARGGASAATEITVTVFFPVGVIRVPRPELLLDVLVVLGAGIGVFDQQGNRAQYGRRPYPRVCSG